MQKSLFLIKPTTMLKENPFSGEEKAFIFQRKTFRKEE